MNVHLASTTTTPPPPALSGDGLIDARQLFALLRIGNSTGWRWWKAGRLLDAIDFGSGTKPVLRWRAAEVREWINAGCPSKREWATRQAARKN